MGNDTVRSHPERTWKILLRDGQTVVARGHKVSVEGGLLMVVRYPGGNSGPGVTTFGSGPGAWSTFTEIREPDSAGGKTSSISRRFA